jgi:hypothetical protein
MALGDQASEDLDLDTADLVLVFRLQLASWEVSQQVLY